jgi:peroxiredoxin
MKRAFLSIICFLPALAMCQNGYTLQGKIGNLNAPAKAYLTYKTTTDQITDSAVIVNGAFKFSGKVESPAPAAIRIKHNDAPVDPNQKAVLDVFSFYIENTNMTISAPDSAKHAKLGGSKLNDDASVLKAKLKPFSERMDVLRAEYRSKSPEQQKDQAYIATLDARAAKIEKETKTIYKDFAFANTKSFIGLVAFRNYLGQDMNEPDAYADFNRFSEQVRQTPLGKAISTSLNATKNTAVGSMAMDFTQNDVNDKPVKLSDFRGKYVLLDFWASWCGPCRKENPNVVAAFNKYKDKNFTVLGVSLDNPGKKEAWLKAIADDKLTWTQVSDLKSWQNEVAQQWGVQSIPASFLIDPTGKIIGKNLRGEELLKKLEELLGSSSK